MIIGKVTFKRYTVDITADTKPEDLKYITDKHPEFAQLIGIEDDNNSKRSKKDSKASDKSSDGAE